MPQALPKALVAFSGQTDLRWLRLLRPGFRHCFVVMELTQGERSDWLLYNPLSVGTQITLWPDAHLQGIRSWLSAQGYAVVETHVQPIQTHLFEWRPYTCVEAVKRALGLHAGWVWTPWQLYRRLKKFEITENNP